jgi:hypothetical protein
MSLPFWRLRIIGDVLSARERLPLYLGFQTYRRLETTFSALNRQEACQLSRGRPGKLDAPSGLSQSSRR